MNITKCIVLAAMALLLALDCLGQKPDIAPVQVIWKNGSDNVTISEAMNNGVELTRQTSTSAPYSLPASKAQSQISIECLFKSKDFADAYPDGADFDVKWYCYMSTRKIHMLTKTITVKADDYSADGLVSLVCSYKQNPKEGWWEVQIKNRQNGSVVSYADQDTYQILLK